MNEIIVSKVVVENFRGYKKEQVFEMGSKKDSIFIYGINGAGKTTFFDAIEWGLTGNLFRFSESNDEKNSSKFIKFQPSDNSERAKVVIEFSEKEKVYKLTRELKDCRTKSSDYGENNTTLKLELPDGTIKKGFNAKEALDKIMINEQWRGKVKFQDVFSQFHLLTQDKLKYFVQGVKAPKRHEYMTSLLGTDRFLKYKDQFKDIESEIKIEIDELEKDIKDIENQLDTTKMLLNNTVNINKGKWEDIEGYLNNLVKEVNEIYSDLNIKKYILETNAENMEIISEMKEGMIRNKQKIRLKINTNKSDYDNLKKIIEAKKEYHKDKKIYMQASNKIQKVNIYNELKYLKDNFKDYISFEKYERYYKEKKISLKKKYESYKQYTMDLNTLYTKVERYGTKKEKYINSIKELNSQIEIIFTEPLNFSNFKVGGKIIPFKELNYNKPIVLKNLIDGNGEKPNNKINDEYQLKYNSIKEKLNNQREYLNEKIILLEELNKEKETVINEITELNKLEKHYKELLTQSLEFIENNITSSEIQDKCPLCDNNINSNILIKKIKKKMSNGNKIIKGKIEKLDKIKCNLEDLNADIKNIYTEVNKQYNEFWDMINEIQSHFDKIDSYLKEESVALKTSLKELEFKYTEKKAMIKEYISIKENSKISITESNQFKEYLDEKTKVLLKDIHELDIDLDKFSIDLEEKKIQKLYIKIKAFEEELKSLDLDNDYNVINEIVNRIEQENGILIKKESDLLNKESQVIELEKVLKNNENSAKMSMLEKLLDEKKSIYNKKLKSYNNILQIRTIIPDTISELNKKIMEENEKLINAIFNKVYPHPNYRNIRFLFGEKYGNKTLQVMCYDGNEKNIINPGFVFSSAQINVVAISIFLAISLYQNCTRLKTIFLDDPIQHMDDINILSLIDVLRSSIDGNILNKQIVMSTHDKKMYKLFMKKFRNYNLRAFKFHTYGIEGPKVNIIDN